MELRWRDMGGGRERDSEDERRRGLFLLLFPPQPRAPRTLTEEPERADVIPLSWAEGKSVMEPVREEVETEGEAEEVGPRPGLVG